MSVTVATKVLGADANINSLIDQVYGTMAKQDASAVTITGGTISGAATIGSVAVGLAGAGTTQADATVVGFGMSVFSTVASGTGAVLPLAVAGRSATIFNQGAQTLLIYPFLGGAINALSANAGLSLAAGKAVRLECASATQWYSLPGA